jgi:hypothetical protein
MLQHKSCTEWARGLGSTATTHRGAVRYLRAVLCPPKEYGELQRARQDRTSEEDEEARNRITETVRIARQWRMPGSQPISFRSGWREYRHDIRMARRADRIAAELGITWTQADAIAEAERLTRLDVERCYREAFREEARRRKRAIGPRKRAMGRRSVLVINRTTDYHGHPLILWWRKGDRHRRLTGWDDGHVWTVQVPLRLGTAKEALYWLLPDNLTGYWERQGEWFFVPVDSHTGGCCFKALYDGSAIDSEGGSEYGTWHETVYQPAEWTNTRHRAQCAVVAQKSGEVAFVGRKGGIRTHRYTAKPRLFVQGSVTAPDHEKLFLERWYEVIGNRAVGAPAAVAAGLD